MGQILPNHNTKAGKVLAGLLERSYNRFEAEILLHDHCLHSTVSELQNRLGITISRHFETISGYQGNPTRCCRYWITQEERDRIENQRINAGKKKTQTTSVETKGMGFYMNDINHTSDANKSQIELNNRV